MVDLLRSCKPANREKSTENLEFSVLNSQFAGG